MTFGRYAGPSEMKARKACVEAVKLPTKKLAKAPQHHDKRDDHRRSL